MGYLSWSKSQECVVAEGGGYRGVIHTSYELMFLLGHKLF